MFPVFVERGRPYALDFPAGKRRFEHGRGVDRSLGGTGADEGMDLVDEDDDLGMIGELLHDGLEALFELSPVLGACHQGAEVELDDPLLQQGLWHEAAHDPLGETLGDGRLADPRFSDEDGIVLCPPGEDLDNALDLVLAADHGVELLLPGEVAEIAAELAEERGVLLVFSLSGRRYLEEGYRLFTDHGEADAEALHHLSGGPVFFLHQSEEKVLCPDIVLAEETSFLDGELEDLFRPRGKRDFAEGEDVLGGRKFADQFGLELLEIDAHVLHYRDRYAAPLPQDAEKEVLCAEILVLVLLGLTAGQNNYPARALGESFKH